MLRSSSMNNNPHRRLDMLLWLQKQSKKNPKFLKDTTARFLCNMYAMQADGVSSNTAQCIFTKMIKQNVIIKHKLGGQRSNYRINYLYPGLPKEFLENAPEEDKAHIKKVMDIFDEREKEGLDVRIESDGTVVSKPKAEPEVEKVEEPVEEKTADPVEPVEPEAVEVSMPEAEAIEEPVQTAVPITLEKDGQSLSITINLNINLGGK